MVMYRPHQFAKAVGVSVPTLRRWDNEGILVAKRTSANQRYYTDEDFNMLRGKKPIEQVNVVYCRVSSSNQKRRSEITNLGYGNILSKRRICDRYMVSRNRGRYEL